MTGLNFPYYPFKIRQAIGDSKEILDEVRGRWVALTPEEWVRQHVVRYMINDKKYPLTLTHIEALITINRQKQRADVVFYQKEGKPLLIIECKAPSVEINQQVFDQAVVYNSVVNAPYLLVTNGINHFCCKLDIDTKKYSFLKEIPEYSSIIQD